MNQFGAILSALRPRQWTKNLLLFAALVFSEQYDQMDSVVSVVIGTALFCMLSSAGYLVNDLRDIEADKAHPKKKFRPIAAGLLSPGFGWTLAGLLMIVGLGGSFFMDSLNAVELVGGDDSPAPWERWAFGSSALAYLCVTLSYTAWFKHVVLLDVMLIASGFLLRAVAGATVIPVESSPWFLTCTAFAALFLGLNKRLAELRLLESGAGSHRRILEDYSPALLSQLIGIVTACTLMAYALYTFTGPHGSSLMATIPFVMYGMFRYLFLVERHGQGGAPENILLGDRPLQLCIGLFVALAVLLLRVGA